MSATAACVHLVGAQALSAVLRAPSHFIDGRLIEPNRRLVGLRLPGFALELKDGAWQRLPPNKNLTSDRLNDFVAQWTNAHALAVEPATARPTLASVRLTLTRENAKPQHTEVLPAVPRDAKPETLTLEILAYKPTFVLRRRDEKLGIPLPRGNRQAPARHRQRRVTSPMPELPEVETTLRGIRPHVLGKSVRVPSRYVIRGCVGACPPRTRA